MTTEALESLAERAEQAVLGALFLRPDVFQDIAYLDPAQFADPARAALFGAIRTELSRDPDQSGSTLSAHLDNVYAAIGASPDYEALANACPHPESVAAYARMLVESDLHRTMQLHAARLRDSSEPNTQLHAEAEVLDRASVTISDEAEQAPIPGGWKGSRPNREERVLADLIQHPNELDQLPPWLSPDNFSSLARSDAFDALQELHRRAEPVDRLTLAWELDRIQHAGTIGAPSSSPGVDPLAYIDRLAAIAVTPGTASEVIPSLANPTPQTTTHPNAPRTPRPGPTYSQRAQAYAVERQLGRDRIPEPEPDYPRPSYDPPRGPERGHGPRMGS